MYDRTGFSSLRSAADQHSHRPAARLGARALAPRHLLRRRFFRDDSLDNCRCHHALRPRPSVPLRSSRWRANVASANANQESKSNLLVRCRSLSATAGTHRYPCAVGQGRLGNEHVHAKVPNVRCAPVALFLADKNRRRAYGAAWFSARGVLAGHTRPMSSLPHVQRMPSRARLFLPLSWWLSWPRFPPRTDLRLFGALVERAGEASWCRAHAMGSYLWAHGASAIYGGPVCHTGRCEQWTSCGVKDGRWHPELDLPVDERVIHPPDHTALRRHIAGGVLGSPQAVGGRLGVSRRPVAARADVRLAGGVSWSSARPRCASLRPAPSQRVPPISQAHSALNPHVHLPPQVRVSESRLPARRQVLAARGRSHPAPPPAPPPRRTAAGGPPSPSPPGAVMGHRRLRHHPRRSTFTAANLATASPLPPFMRTRSRYTLAAVLSPRGRRLRL